MNGKKQFCTFSLDGNLFGVGAETVQEIIRSQELTNTPFFPSIVRGMINLRGRIHIAIDLRRKLGMEDRPENQLPMNMVVRTNDGIVSLMVDEMGDMVEVAKNTLEPIPYNLGVSTMGFVLGSYQLESRLLFVLDTEKSV